MNSQIHEGSGGIDAFAIQAAKLGGSRLFVVTGSLFLFTQFLYLLSLDSIEIQSHVCRNFILDFTMQVVMRRYLYTKLRTLLQG